MRLIGNFILLVSVVFYSSLASAGWSSQIFYKQGDCESTLSSRLSSGSITAWRCDAWANKMQKGYGFYPDANSNSPCTSPQVWNQETFQCGMPDSDGDGIPDDQDSCPNDPDLNCTCPPNHTTINGQCEANVWCSGPPKGYIAANMICPSPASPNTPDSQSEAAEDGRSAGAAAGSSAGAEAAANGSTAEEAAKAGGAAGAAAGAQKSAAAGGASAAQAEAIGAAVHEAMQTDPSAAKAMAAAEQAALNQGLSPAEANQAGIAAAAGYEAGLQTGTQAYANISNGADLITTADCVGGVCNYTQTFSCPSGTSPMPVGGALACVPNKTSPPCDSKSLAGCDIPDCQFGIWNGSSCSGAITMANCPAGFTPNENNVCQQNPAGTITDMNGQPANTSCPSGYVFTGSSCIQMVASTSTRVTTNPDGSTTTEIIYNSPSGWGQGQGQQQDQESGAGECDPESKDYAQCIGQIVEVSDNADQDIISGLNAAAESALNDFESDYIDELTGSSNVLDVATGLITDPITSLLPQSSTCDSSALSIAFSHITISLSCARLNQFKNLFGWALNLITAWTLFAIALSPVQSKV